MKKHLFSIILALVMCVILILDAPTVSALEETSGTFGSNLTWSIENGTLTISGQGEMTINEIPPWFSDSGAGISHIVLEPGVTSICHNAFVNFSDLTKVTLPEGLEIIGQDAFSGCKNLTEIHLPESLISIFPGAFSQCGLVEIVLPNGVNLGTGVFMFCESLQHVTLPAGMTYLPDETFYECKSLTEIQLPETLEEINSAAFCGSGLKKIDIPNNVTLIGLRAFENCESLTQINLPDNLTFIGEYCFRNCINLTALELPDHFTNFTQQGLFQGSGLKEMTISSADAKLGWWLFQGCPNLTQVTLPEGITELGREVFADCPNLETVILPQSLESMDTGVFRNSGLKHIQIPKQITKIPKETFLACTKLYNVVLPAGITIIDNYAFKECTSLYDITLPETLGIIRRFAFQSSGLQRIQIPSSVHTIEEEAFGSCKNLRAVIFPESQMGIHGSTFMHSGNVTIYCYENTVAQEAARLAGIKCVLLDPSVRAFADLKPEQFYYTSVAWAVENGITNGRTATTFAPGDPCKRSEVVTFLHRSQGKPVPGSVQSKFTDVKIGKFYTDAVAWAVEEGITNGMGDGTFGVDQNCTRAQVVTFLWRAAGSPEPTSTDHPFTDLNPEGFYYKAVLWAVEKGITKGMTATTFGVGETCTRGQIVTFLHRFAG